jgi:hypothetical protein
MKLSKLRDDRDYFTGKLSEIIRQLDFAGLAVIWIFRTGGKDSGGISYSDWLIWPMLFLVVSLALDLLHYVYSSAVWDWVYRGFDRAGKGDNEDVRFSKKFSLGGRLLFWLKVVATLVAYGLLIAYVAQRL